MTEKNPSPVSVVLCGIGGYGNLHLTELLKDVDAGLCTLAGIVDPAASRAPQYEKVCARNIPIYNDLDAFYREHEAELCSIASPIAYHTRQTVCAMRHGSHVLCEKPLSGEWRDAALLTALSEETGKFVMTGYQWSYNRAVLALKKDILAGKYGKPKRLKTVILWPRVQSYFRRGSGWAGTRYAPDGTKVFDSIANNAAAHYLHNMFFVTGDALDTARRPVSVDCELFRVNPIENFDTSVIRCRFADGAEALFYASHTVAKNRNPRFCYEFEKGTVTYDADAPEKSIIGVFSDGTTVSYGNPYADDMEKIRIAIANVRCAPAERNLVCTPKTAEIHAQCIEAVSRAEIVTLPETLVEKLPYGADGGDVLYTVKGLGEALDACYDDGCMLSEGAAVPETLRSCAKLCAGIPVADEE